jgi:hypothetical protein
MRKLSTVMLAALCAAVAAPAFAGFTVTTSPLTVNNTDLGAPGGSLGDSFSIGGALATADSIPGGTFLTYIPDTPFDPQITGGDLNLFRFNLTGTITNIAGNVATYDGDYLIFYDQTGDGEPNEGLIVSGGDFAGSAIFDLATGETATFTGTLTQTQDPNNATFADLSYGGSPVLLSGTYIDSTLGNGPSATGTLTATLRQNAVGIPEPGTFALASIGVVGALLRRRMS